MVLAKTKLVFTVEDYLKIDRTEDERYEFFDGEIYAMAGESGAHGDICMNLAGILYMQLRDSNCRGRIKDTKVRSGMFPVKRPLVKGMISYPDIVVICGEPEYHDEFQDVVVNPQVIIEVLSESTESFDRGEKFHRYQLWSPTLTDYILVSQDKPLVEHYIRQSDGSWKYIFYKGLEGEFSVDSIDSRLKSADVYYRIEFDEEQDI
ncbi:MAG TPA: Uma2 family endonuclease [Pyrinomonadaceae bacterium]|nr:Uma2 family endonuclease [Pyrinomonadaceae bacterium]